MADTRAVPWWKIKYLHHDVCLERCPECGAPFLGAAEIQWKAVFGDVPAGLEKIDALAVVNSRYRRMAADANSNDAELRRLNLVIEKARAELTASAP